MIGRISSRAVFSRLRRSGVQRRSGPLAVVVVELVAGERPSGGVAFAIPRAVGPAVVRNRLRRRLREHLRNLDRAGLVPPGWYLVIVHPGAAALSGPALRDRLTQLVGVTPT